MDTGAETPNSDLEALLFFHKTFFKFCKLFAQKIWFSMSFARLSAQKSWFSSGFAIFLHTNNGFLNSASFLRKTVAFLRFCKLFAQKHVFSLDFVSFGNKTLSHAFCGKPLVFLEFRKLFAQKQMFSLGFCTLSEQLFRRRPKKWMLCEIGKLANWRIGKLGNWDPKAWEQNLCIFTRHPKTWTRIYAFVHGILRLGSRIYAFLRGILRLWEQNLYIFTQHPKALGTESLHFYAASQSLGAESLHFYVAS